MKFKSIQLKITFLTGIFLFLIVLALVVYSIISLREESFELAKSRALGSARENATKIQVEIEVALNSARTMAHSLTVAGANSNEIGLTREMVNKILIAVLERNDSFLGTYTLWEPNAFDGNDSEFANSEGHDATGRFIPYWTKGKGGAVIEALAGYEDTTEDELGGRAGDYYLIPRETKNEAIIDPYVYSVQGKDTLLTSLVVPVLSQNRFYGIAGVDIALDFLQKQADELNLYDKTAKMLLLSHKGILAGVTGQSELIGRLLKEYETHPEDQKLILDAIKSKKEIVFIDEQEDLLKVQVPIFIGKTTTNWAVQITIPTEKVFEDANAIMVQQIVIGMLLVLIGIAVLWWISRSIARPLRETTGTLSKIAEKGDFSLRIRSKQVDEIGQMSQSVNDLMTALQNAIDDLNKVFGAVASGDLSMRVTANFKGDLAKLKEASNKSIEQLGQVLNQVRLTSLEVNNGAEELAGSAQALASGNSEQAASLEEVSSSMSEVSGQAETNSKNALQAQQLSNETMNVVERGNAQMSEMLKSMDQINSTSSDISKIIKAIDEIAFQTNLLALNAAVEAARAGKYGKGFAVVAEEVRNLAARSAEAAKTTTDLIENSVKEVERGVDNAQKTDEVLKEISTSVTKINDMVSEISSGSTEQQSGIEEINKGLTQVNNVVQQNSSISEETASASEELSGQSTNLQHLISKFKTSQSQTDLVQAQHKLPEKEDTTFQKAKVPHAKMITLDDDSFGKY